MPHHKSCKKRLKLTEQERVRNNALRTLLRKTLKDARVNIDEGKEIDLKEAYSSIDKVADRGVIPKKKAARLKSRLTRAAAKAAAEAAAPDTEQS